MDTKTENVLNNFINGNLQDAKQGAKNVSANKLYCALIECYGYSTNKAHHTVKYLKHGGSFQAACDAE